MNQRERVRKRHEIRRKVAMIEANLADGNPKTRDAIKDARRRLLELTQETREISKEVHKDVQYTREQLLEVETIVIRSTHAIGYNFLSEYDYDYEAFKMAYDTPDVGDILKDFTLCVRVAILDALEMPFKDVPLSVNVVHKIKERQFIPLILKWRLKEGV